MVISSDVLDEVIQDSISEELIVTGASLDVSFEIALRGSLGKLRERAIADDMNIYWWAALSSTFKQGPINLSHVFLPMVDRWPLSKVSLHPLYSIATSIP